MNAKVKKRLGLRPRPHWGSFQRSPRPPSCYGRGHAPSSTHPRLVNIVIRPPLSEILDPPLALPWNMVRSAMEYGPFCHGIWSALPWNMVRSAMEYGPLCHGIWSALPWNMVCSAVEYGPLCSAIAIKNCVTFTLHLRTLMTSHPDAASCSNNA